MQTVNYKDEQGNIFIADAEGNCTLVVKQEDILGMGLPVKCNHCGKVYDLTTVKVSHRYADCDQFITPCCDYRFADTRTWKSFLDYERLDKYC